MGAALRLVRLVQIAMLASIALCAVTGERLAHLNHNPANTLFHALSVISISLAGATVVIRQTMVLPAEGALQKRSDDDLAIARWKTGYLFLYVLCEILGIFGLVLRLSGFTLANVWGFYLGGFLLLLVYSPRRPRLPQTRNMR
jgi:hypothetical protein